MSSLHYHDGFVRKPDRQAYESKQVSVRLYASVVVLTGSLAVIQFYFLPHNLGTTEFGLVVLGLSANQAALQFSDIGLINASLRSDIDDDTRVALRNSAVSVSTLLCAGLIAAASVAGIAGMHFGYVLAAGFVCAICLIGGRAQASAAVHTANERSATRHNIMWQNATKIGSVVGSFIGTALMSMIGAAVTSICSGRPHMPRHVSWHFLKAHRKYWMPGLAVSASAFALSWVDTYVLSIVSGVEVVGEYQAIVRPLTGVTYIYLPIVALIQSAHNAGAIVRLRLLTIVSVVLGAGGSAIVAIFLIFEGSDIWPLFAFEPRTVIAATAAATAFCFAFVFGAQLILHGRHTAAAVNSTIGTALLVALSIPLIKEWGAFGAGVASATAWGLVAVCHGSILLLRRRSK